MTKLEMIWFASAVVYWTRLCSRGSIWCRGLTSAGKNHMPDEMSIHDNFIFNFLSPDWKISHAHLQKRFTFASEPHARSTLDLAAEQWTIRPTLLNTVARMSEWVCIGFNVRLGR